MRLTPTQKRKLIEHSKHHTKKHMAMMEDLMKNGLSFTAAHTKTMKRVGK